MIYSDNVITPRYFTYDDVTVPVYDFDAVVIGTGISGLNAAEMLYNNGFENIAVITEGMRYGVSHGIPAYRNFLYKQALGEPDSIPDFTEQLKEYGVDNDFAELHAAYSLKSYFKLIGLSNNQDYIYPLPEEFALPGEKVRRLTGCDISELAQKLENAVLNKNIPVFNRFRIVSFIKEKCGDTEYITGALAIDTDMQREYTMGYQSYIRGREGNKNKKNLFVKIAEKFNREKSDGEEAAADYPGKDLDITGNIFGYTLFQCKNIIFGAGGAGKIYMDSSYPERSTCSMGTALNAGVEAVDITEIQSGIYMPESLLPFDGPFIQSVPRIYSVNPKSGEEYDFLGKYFKEDTEYLVALSERSEYRYTDFSKPSGIIDIAFQLERINGRRIYADFNTNPAQLKSIVDNAEDMSFSSGTGLSPNMAALPCERLMDLDSAAYKCLAEYGDIASRPVELTVGVTHHAGGLKTDSYYETNIRGFFAVGEAAALSSNPPYGFSLITAVTSSERAALRISERLKSEDMDAPVRNPDFWVLAHEETYKYIVMARRLLINADDRILSANVDEIRSRYTWRSTTSAGIFRCYNDVLMSLANCAMDIGTFIDENKIDSVSYLCDVFINLDILLTQFVFFSAIKYYLSSGGAGRSSYLTAEDFKEILAEYDNGGSFDAFKGYKLSIKNPPKYNNTANAVKINKRSSVCIRVLNNKTLEMKLSVIENP